MMIVVAVNHYADVALAQPSLMLVRLQLSYGI